MALDERLAKAIEESIAVEFKREVTQLNRKLKTALRQRDEWKYKAKHWHAKLLERDDARRP